LSTFVRRVSRVGINIVNTFGSEIESLEGSKASFCVFTRESSYESGEGNKE